MTIRLSCCELLQTEEMSTEGKVLRRIIEISKEGLFLSTQRGCLVISEKSTELSKIPFSDIAVLLITAKGTTLTKNAMLEIIQHEGVVMFCGNTFKPETIMVPLCGNYEFSGRLADQTAASLPLQKQLWKQIIEEKIRNQATVLHSFGLETESKQLRSNADRVLSGDTDNREGVAARVYWSALMGKGFSRNPDEPGINALLNYGYAILRGTIARAVCCAGLHPSLGIFHSNKKNNYCLVDDLMEPFRPLVDFTVKQLVEKGGSLDLTPACKSQLSKIAWVGVWVDKGKSPLITACEYYCTSLVQSYQMKKNLLCVPQLTKTATNTIEQTILLPI